jgi:hypothetical protein
MWAGYETPTFSTGDYQLRHTLTQTFALVAQNLCIGCSANTYCIQQAHAYVEYIQVLPTSFEVHRYQQAGADGEYLKDIYTLTHTTFVNTPTFKNARLIKYIHSFC